MLPTHSREENDGKRRAREREKLQAMKKKSMYQLIKGIQ
jgi:hypothetical protein